MSNTIEAVLQKLVEILARHDAIRAIGLSGGDGPFPEPGKGDIDIFVYCTEIPAEEQRKELLSSLKEGITQVEIGKLEGGHWGLGDCFLMAGVETWLLYFTLDEARAELEATLAGKYPGRLDSYYYPIGRCAMWKTIRACYDPDGFLQMIKERLVEYPPELADKIIEDHLQALEDVEDLERAVQRRDVLFYHFALDLALDHFLQALFAMNSEYFPSRKRSEIYMRVFRIKPTECEARLRQVIRLGGTEQTLEQSHRTLNGLIQDLVGLKRSKC